MKKVLLTVLILSIGWVSPGFAREFLSSNITEVTLFSNQALVSRACRADVHPGLNELLVEVTAFAVDKDSVTASVTGRGEIVSVQIKEFPLSEFPQEQVRAIEVQLQEYHRSQAVLNDRKTVLSKKEVFLDSLIEFSKTQMPKDMQTRFPDIQEIEKTLAYMGKEAEAINQDRQVVDEKIDAVRMEIDRLKRELSALRGNVQQTRRAVEVLFNARQSEAVDLTVQYLTPHAAWHPLYKASVPLDFSGVELSLFSKISQKSGENWPAIDLSISNVIPLKGARLPESSSWLLDLPRPRPLALRKSRVLEAPTAEPMEMARDDYLAGVPTEAAAGYAEAVATEMPLAFEYRLPFPVDIESRDAWSILPIFTRTLKGTIFYRAIPRKSVLSYVVAEATADRELLSGQMNVYFGGRYIGETRLEEIKPGDPFHLNLGADRGVKVKREKIKDKMRETYFGTIQRDTVVREFEYKITAENLKNQAVPLQIEDSVPVSKTDKIQVKDLQLLPEPAMRDDRDKAGVMRWDLELAPGKPQEILIRFTVSYPADTPPMGL